jgi:septal ring factor EnvC (AmiA/AmiB activator)
MADEGWIGQELTKIQQELTAQRKELAQVKNDQDALLGKMNALITTESQDHEFIRKSYTLLMTGISELGQIAKNINQILAYVSPQPPKPPAGFTADLTLDK